MFSRKRFHGTLKIKKTGRQHFFPIVAGDIASLQRETNIWIKVILQTYAQKIEKLGRMGGQPESCQLYFHLHILFCFLFHFQLCQNSIFFFYWERTKSTFCNWSGLRILRKETLHKACIWHLKKKKMQRFHKKILLAGLACMKEILPEWLRRLGRETTT